MSKEENTLTEFGQTYYNYLDTWIDGMSTGGICADE